jgi:hypothetical protein
MSGDILNLLQVIFEQALTTGLIWTGAVVLAVTVTVVGLAFSPTARPRVRAREEPTSTLLTHGTPRSDSRRRRANV